MVLHLKQVDIANSSTVLLICDKGGVHKFSSWVMEIRLNERNSNNLVTALMELPNNSIDEKGRHKGKRPLKT